MTHPVPSPKDSTNQDPAVQDPTTQDLTIQDLTIQDVTTEVSPPIVGVPERAESAGAPPAGTGTSAEESTSDSEPSVPTLLQQLGGVGGLVSSVVPVMVFVVMNPLVGLQLAIWSSLGAGVAVGLWRLIRREPLQPAISGILGVGLCAFIAYRTGEARGFYLYGIWYSLVAGLAFALSVAVRRPLVGVLWSALNGSGFGWLSDSRARFGYQVATLVWAVFFLARFGVQRWLYDAQETTLLGVARLAMGLPLTAVAALITIWAVRRAARSPHAAAVMP